MNSTKTKLIIVGVSIFVIVCLILLTNKNGNDATISVAQTDQQQHLKPKHVEVALQDSTPSPSEFDHDRYSEIVNEAVTTPINFFGIVLDQNEKPIEGATATLTVTDSADQPGLQYVVESDKNGHFYLKNAKGASVTVNVHKDGYYSGSKASGSVPYFFRDRQSIELPTASSPFVFYLTQKGQGAALVKFRKNVNLNTEGKSIRVNLSPKSGFNDVIYFKLKTEQASTTQKQYNWNFEIEVPGGGLLLKENDYGFLAPENGYLDVYEIKMNKDDPNGWSSTSDKYDFFVKLPSGNYALLNVYAKTSGKPFAKFTSLVNPMGSRNLEFNPEKEIR